MDVKIISAFPACGKTYFAEKNKKDSIDIDSSLFHWIFKEDNLKTRNPNFPQNYINHIKEQLEKYRFIFISSHHEVRRALKENNLQYTLIYPDKSLRETWIERFQKRGNDNQFICFMKDNWDSFIFEIEEEEFPKKIKLKENQYISDVLK